MIIEWNSFARQSKASTKNLVRKTKRHFGTIQQCGQSSPSWIPHQKQGLSESQLPAPLPCTTTWAIVLLCNRCLFRFWTLSYTHLLLFQCIYPYSYLFIHECIPTLLHHSIHKGPLPPLHTHTHQQTINWFSVILQEKYTSVKPCVSLCLHSRT